MKSKKDRIPLKIILLASAMLLPASLSALDPPASTVNPLNGYIETADTLSQGGTYNIRHAANPGGGEPMVVTMVSTDTADEYGARIVNNPAGDTYVAWWRDLATDEVRIRTRNQATGSWGSATQVSDSGTGSRKPELVHDGDDLWVAFEGDGGPGEVDIIVRTIRDDPVPVLILGTTTFTGDIDIRMHLETGHFWISWVDDDCAVGWSEYDGTSESWSVAAYESCDSDSVGDARGRIRTELLGS